MRISDWSSDVCSSDLGRTGQDAGVLAQGRAARDRQRAAGRISLGRWPLVLCAGAGRHGLKLRGKPGPQSLKIRSEEHTSELQSLMRISYAVFCLKKKKHNITIQRNHNHTLRINMTTAI